MLAFFGPPIILWVLCGPLPGLAGVPDNPFTPGPPHDVSRNFPPCACHMIPPAKETSPPPPKVGELFSLSDDFLSARCLTCHSVRCAHPSDVPIASPGPGLRLGREGARAGQLICTTCHDIHGGKIPPFLRTLGEQARVNRLSCDVCHAAGKYMMHGKSESDFGRECAPCHTAPTDGGKSSLKEGFGKTCLLCHPDPPMGCLAALEPKTAEVITRQIGSVPLPLDRGKLTCGSCHRAMAAPDGRKLLRQEYTAFRAKILGKDIHRSGVLCAPCHGAEVRKGERNPALADKDIEKLCRACHDNKLARADIHPSGIVPQTFENISIPRGFPLHEGKLVCPTCHVVCRVAKRDAEGAFLRGGPFRKREHACFECHSYKGYMGFNPHRQIDESGKLNEKVCLYCHSSLPDRKHKGIAKEGFAGDVKTYCVGCHQDNKMHPHPANVQHFGARPSEGMKLRIMAFEDKHKVMFPMGFEGEVLCFTCHNPHQQGVLSGQAAARDFHSRLRMAGQYVVCNACHGGGGLK